MSRVSSIDCFRNIIAFSVTIFIVNSVILPAPQTFAQESGTLGIGKSNDTIPSETLNDRTIIKILEIAEALRASDAEVERLSYQLTKLDSRMALLESPTKDHDGGILRHLPWLAPSIFAILSALLGAFVGHLSARRLFVETEASTTKTRQMADTVAICTEWIQRSGDVANTKYLLENPQKLNDPRNFNRVVDYGNWLELLMSMRAQDLLNSDFLDQFKTDERIKEFKQGIESASRVIPDLKTYSAFWKHLQ